MKIAICCHPKFGGSGVVASELAVALAAAGDEVHVLSSAPPPRLQQMTDEAAATGDSPAQAGGVRFHLVEAPSYPVFEHPSYTLALLGGLVEIARRGGLDVIHAHYALPHGVAGVLAQQILDVETAPAVVVTCHGTDVSPVGNHPAYAPATRFALEQATAVTAVSRSLQARIATDIGVSRGVEVIPNFVDVHRFGPRPQAASASRVATVIHVSNFRPIKRPLDVVEIFSGIRRHLSCRLVMVGDGPQRAAAEARCRDLGIDRWVSWTGNVRRVEEHLREADLLLLPSEEESFGVAALEAMSCEVPVVASAVGGVPEVVEDGRTGLLFPRRDLQGMIDGACRILADRELALRLGRAGRQRVLGRFTPEVVVPGYRDLYRRAMERARGREAPGGRILPSSPLRLVRP